MPQVPLITTDSERVFAGLPAAPLKNRFVEKSQTQQGGEVLIARPGSKTYAGFGSGPIRSMYTLRGLFGGSAFIVSGTSIYRRTVAGDTIPLTGTIFGTGQVSMAGVKGAGYEYLFIADGTHLQIYSGGTHATGTLTGTANVSEGDVVQIGSSYFEWTATIANGAGTAADPWKVLLGATLADSLTNLNAAISFTGTAGTTYSANLNGQNAEVTSALSGSPATAIVVTAISDLADGNLIATAVPTGTAVTWGGTTLTGGGTHGLNGVAMPDGQPPSSVAVLKGYVIITVGNSGRFYYLSPGSIVINALDFYTAESHPDDTIKAITVGDQVWFIGQASLEPWYATGVSTDPFAPAAGRVFDHGAVDGTAVNIKGTVFLVGDDNVVYSIAGSPQRVSDNGVEELIRKTLEAE